MKKNKGVITIIIILSILVAGLSGYIVYDKVISKEKKTTINKTEKAEQDEIRELNENEFNELLVQIESYGYSLSEYYPIKSVTLLDNDILFDFASRRIREINPNVTFEQMSAADLEKTLEKYFGSNLKLEHKNNKCSFDKEVLYYYDNATKTYKYNTNHPGHGGASGSIHNKSYYVEGKIKNEKEITIKTRNLYGRYCVDTCGPSTEYYKSVEDSRNSRNEILGSEGSDKEYIITQEEYNSVRDKLPITTYKFTKEENGNYALLSVDVSE